MVEAEAQHFSPGELEKIRAAYASALSMPVEIIRSKDFPSLIDAHASARIEYAFYTAEAYAAAFLACECVEPLAAPVAADGSNGIRAAVIANPTLTPAAIASSKGIGLSDPGSLAFGAALASFRPEGRQLTGAEPWIAPVDNAAAAVEAFAAGRMDGLLAALPASQPEAGVLKPGAPLADTVLKSGRPAKILWLSPVMPYGPHAVRKNLAPEAKTLLANMLAGLSTADPDLNDRLLPEGMASFAPIRHADYGLALDAAKALAQTASAPKP